MMVNILPLTIIPLYPYILAAAVQLFLLFWAGSRRNG
jgi:hypothetical protein